MVSNRNRCLKESKRHLGIEENLFADQRSVFMVSRGLGSEKELRRLALQA